MHSKEQLFFQRLCGPLELTTENNTLKSGHGEVEGLIILLINSKGPCYETSAHIQPFIAKALLWNGMHIALPKARSRAQRETIYSTRKGHRF
jgi:hypothetical protein